jgi:hypothetical protein
MFLMKTISKKIKRKSIKVLYNYVNISGICIFFYKKIKTEKIEKIEKLKKNCILYLYFKIIKRN